MLGIPPSNKKVQLRGNTWLTYVDGRVTEWRSYQNTALMLTAQLEEALSEIETLRGFLPICSHCKKIRRDDGDWEQIEAYISHHSLAEFSHGICPSCVKEHYPDFI